MLNVRNYKMVRIRSWNWKSNIFTQRHVQAEIFIFISCLKVWELEKYQQMVLGCKRIHIPRRTFSGFSWDCAGPKSNFQNTFYQGHLWMAASGSCMFKVRNKNSRLMSWINMDISKNDVNGHVFFFDGHSFFFSLRRYILFLTTDLCLSAAAFINCYFTHFSPIFHFYTLWKRQKTCGFLTFSGGIEMEYCSKMGK